jgi:hypothetical protein
VGLSSWHVALLKGAGTAIAPKPGSVHRRDQPKLIRAVQDMALVCP